MDQFSFTRRSLIIGASSAAVSSLSGLRAASALNACPYSTPPGGCSALIDPQRFLRDNISQRQRQSQWCWAACVSMICNWHNHPISQDSIVNRVYGGLVNMPGDDRVLTSTLNSQWTDDAGVSFSISARTFSPMLGTNNVSNQLVVDDLTRDRPLLVGARSHATVLARVDYQPTQSGQPQIFQAHVIDPWPGAAAAPYYARFLAPDELVPATLGGSLRFLASIRIM
ncbi:papain-like cysteine protease family protein [Mesorhizobium marinum]